MSGTIWTVGTYAVSMAIRLGSNIILSRLLAPELIGIIVVVNTVKVGVELFSDLGLEQNIVNSRVGDQDRFFNTAWTIQILRGFFLSVIFMLITPRLSEVYSINIEVFLLIALAPFINSVASTSIFILVKEMKVRQRYGFEICCDIITLAATVSFVLISPSVFSVVSGTLLGLAARSLLSYKLPHPPHRLLLAREHVFEIVHFGKWIMLSSLLMYVSGQVDKIYLGQAMPLAVFGIYGLARTIADLPAVLAGRLCYQIFFPLISATRSLGSDESVRMVGRQRRLLVLLAAIGVSSAIAWSDYAIKVLYDDRYYDAGWMLCVLLCGSWFSVLAGLNEAVLLAKRPSYHSFSHAVRLLAMLLGLSLGYSTYGAVGAVAAVSASEVFRYATLAAGQLRVRFSFLLQDAGATLVVCALVGLWSIGRHCFGLGVAWELLR